MPKLEKLQKVEGALNKLLWEIWEGNARCEVYQLLDSMALEVRDEIAAEKIRGKHG